MKAQGSGKLPSQMVVNSRENASAVILRNGNELEERPPASKLEDKDEDKKHNIEKEKEVSTSNYVPHYITPPPFSSRLAPKKKEEKEREFLDAFRKMEVNIPLVDAIKQVPRYGKFLKDLCTNKKRQSGNEKVNVGGECVGGTPKEDAD